MVSQPKQLREGAARNQADVVAVGEDDGGVGMDLARRQSRHAMVHAPRQLADLGMQRAAERDVHLLKAAADAEDRHAAGDADLDQRQRQGVAGLVVGLMRGMRLGPEAGRVHVGAGARQQDAVDHLEQRVDIRDFRRAREHQRQRAGDLAPPRAGSFLRPAAR